MKNELPTPISAQSFSFKRLPFVISPLLANTKALTPEIFAVHGITDKTKDEFRMPPFRENTICIGLSGDGRFEGKIGDLHAPPTFVGKGALALIPAGMENAWRVCEGDGHILNLLLSPTLIARVAEQVFDVDRARSALNPSFFTEDPLILQIGIAVATALPPRAAGDGVYIESLGHTLSVHLLQHYVDVPVSARPVKGRLPGAVLRNVVDYVAEQPNSELSLSKLAALAHLSPYHFARLFKETTGQTVHGYVLEQRLLRSRYLLLASRLPISYIAMEMGFADESHFVRCFKELFGVTPGIVRRSTVQ
jgi:AraC family transcriptional regulator